IAVQTLDPSDIQKRSDRTELRIFQGGAVVVFLAGLFLPLTRFPSICIFLYITGLPCPGCGLTRSIHLTLNGKILQALQFHPFGLPALAWLCFLILSIFIPSLSRFYVKHIKQIHRLYATGALLMLAFGVVRLIGLLMFGGLSWVAPSVLR
ncbi:MAG TPA: DUF2752 domain-containing protein, partial [Leptospiraceae bacterium]|nr:DUF2752 domain-containing protein [Leptospiraceae bacterium]